MARNHGRTMSLPNQPTIQAATSFDPAALCALYDAVGWSAYTRDPDKLLAAFRGSSLVVEARADGHLVGIARCVSDDVSIAYVQDILVHPDRHRTGLGRALLGAVLERYAHVRQKVLLTDDREEQVRFYEAMGFANTRDLTVTRLNAFVIIEGATLA